MESPSVCKALEHNDMWSGCASPLSRSSATYRGMIVGKSVIDIHIFKEPPNVVLKEAFDLVIVVFGVDEDRSDEGLDNVRKALKDISNNVKELQLRLLLVDFS